MAILELWQKMGIENVQVFCIRRRAELWRGEKNQQKETVEWKRCGEGRSRKGIEKKCYVVEKVEGRVENVQVLYDEKLSCDEAKRTNWKGVVEALWGKEGRKG